MQLCDSDPCSQVNLPFSADALVVSFVLLNELKKETGA